MITCARHSGRNRDRGQHRGQHRGNQVDSGVYCQGTTLASSPGQVNQDRGLGTVGANRWMTTPKLTSHNAS